MSDGINAAPAGFEEAVKDLITLGEKTQVPYDTLLKRWTPKRIYAPGTTPAYSNYGASLAGYIVQRTSGEQFDSYLEHHIFGPLGMQHSTFRQPLPANLKPLMAEGYVSGKDKPYGYEFVNAAPAGALAATGDDMAKFMIAHLQNGRAIFDVDHDRQTLEMGDSLTIWSKLPRSVSTRRRLCRQDSARGEAR